MVSFYQLYDSKSMYSIVIFQNIYFGIKIHLLVGSSLKLHSFIHITYNIPCKFLLLLAFLIHSHGYTCSICNIPYALNMTIFLVMINTVSASFQLHDPYP